MSFSQMEAAMMAQFDTISSSLTLKSGDFVIGAYSRNEMFIVKRVKDSLCVANYLTDENYKIAMVFSIAVDDDPLFSKTVDSLFIDIQKKHSYQSCSKGLLNGDNFYLVFPKKR
jgi:hypothetical protein